MPDFRFIIHPLLLLAVLLAATHASAQSFQTSAPFAILFDVNTRSVLFEKDADKLNAPASLAKVMTAAVVFQEMAAGRLKPEDEMVVSAHAWRKGGAVAGNSAMFLTPGQRPKVSELITGLIVTSGNDAALTLAEGISGSEENFARLMNERAKEIGLKDSVFSNPTGLPDPAQRVTVRDLLVVSDYIIRTFPEQYKVFAIKEFTWGKTRQVNRNPLLASDPNADGLKTGNTDESGFGLIGSSVINGQRLIVVVNGLKTAVDRSVEARKLLDWGFRSFEGKALFTDGAEIAIAKVYGGAVSSVGLIAKGEVRTLVPRGDLSKVTATVTYRSPLIAPVQAGTEIAKLHVKRGEINALDIPLYAASEVPVGSLTQRAEDAVWELVSSGAKRAFAKLFPKKPA